MSPARIAAFDVLKRVESGGYASDLLMEFSAALSSRDAGLASEIVFGVLRYQGQLDYLIRLLSGRDPSRLDPEVRITLRMGIYQLRYLERIPSHAAVGESVELVKRARKRSASGLVNAVLRKVTREPVEWPDRAVALSIPAWLLGRWERQFGRDTAESIARAFLKQPETYVRVPGEPPAELSLEHTGVPGCYRLISGQSGDLRIQDIGSQSIVPLLDLKPGQTFLDLCSAPGNKTAQALESGVQAVACDLHWRRLVTVPEGCSRVVLDGTQPLPFAGRFDRILVDAPCSGTGTLGRNPEIKWRVRPADLVNLHIKQVGLLRNALGALAPGGKLVYSTCSLEREENEEVVEEVLGHKAAASTRRIPGRDPGDGFYAAVLGSNIASNG
jgi:16S rRNA (cytosine967-C5)-methyltransferase